MTYLDTCYLTRFYAQEEGTEKILAWAREQRDFVCAIHGRLELFAAFKRWQREGRITSRDHNLILRKLSADEAAGLWRWLPASERLIRQACDQVAALSPKVYLRAADALHLATAADVGLQVIYSHDRHLLAAARHFRLKGIDILAP